MVLHILAAILTLQSPQSATAPLSIEEYIALKKLAAVDVSSDGGTAAFTLTEADVDANAFVTRLFVWDQDRGTRAVANTFVDVQHPRWSGDGARLAFLSAGSQRGNDRGPPQIWTLEISSGSVKRLGEFAEGVIEYDWAPGDSIYVLTSGDSDGQREFWKLNTRDGSAEYVWGGDRGIRDIAVSPDGNSIAFATNGTGAINEYMNYNLRVLDLGTKSTRELTSRPGSETAPQWSPDGATIAFRAPQNSRFPHSQTELFSVAVSSGALTNLTESFDRTVVHHLWPPAGDLLFTAAIGTYTSMFAARADGAIMQVAGGDYCIGSFDAGASGSSIYAIRESATEAAELWNIGAAGMESLTDLNARARRWDPGQQQVIRWTAPDGQAVEGLLIYPAGHQEGRRYPLLVNPAGGPLSRVRNVIDQPAGYQLYAAHGYAILAPNFRGSSGYGENFASARRADLAGGDLVDLLARLDRVVEMGLADPDRIAVYGGSPGAYGAYVTSWAITQTQRFAAAVTIFGSTRPYGLQPPMEAEPPEYALYDAGYMEVLERERSPLGSIANVQTPLLVVAGDMGSLLSRSGRIYEALTELGRTVEYVELGRNRPSQIGPQETTDLFFRQLRWFDRYLKFAGADLLDFFRPGEWVPGPGGWQLSVVRADARPDISGLTPEGDRYLEIELAIRPDETALRENELQGFELDPAEHVSLVAPSGTAQPFVGTITDVFGRETLITGAPGGVSILDIRRAPRSAVVLRLAFEIPAAASEYRLRITGFVPVRIWVAETE
jgi:dipeptidyl aminopeptidase/acylaminoacyl peptidase